MKDFLFLTRLIPDEIKDEVVEKSRNNMQDAASSLQWRFYEGLVLNLKSNPKILNVLPIGSYPQYYDDAFVKKTVLKNGIVNVGFCNIKFFRKILLRFFVYKELLDYYKDKSNCEKTLFVYTIESNLLHAVTKLKRKYLDINVCAIVADMPEMTNLASNKSFLHKIFERRRAKDSYSKLKCVDSFVLLTKYMSEYMKIEQPYCVMEGISTTTRGEDIVIEKDEIKRIVYSGTLHKRFGITNLVDAFKKIDKKNYRLIICGIGDSVAYVNEAAETDSRIEYKGQLSREAVLLIQRTATVLVNPRQNNEMFTKYSFPSKNMEYLSSGIPVVAYKLDGIPDEYDEYLNYVEDDSIEVLKNKLIEICEKDEQSRIEMGKKGADFVLKNKNSEVQLRRVLDFIEKTKKQT